MTATVTPSSATGSVQFLDGTTNLGVATLSGGLAAIAFSPAAGVHSITVVYSGDANDSGSTSTPLTQTVNKTPTSVTVTASAPTTILGAAVTFTARVTPSSATGSVQFLDSGRVLGTSNLSGGTAAFTITTLAAGSHSITASYTGDTNDAASSSPPLTHSVIPNVTVTLRPPVTVRPINIGESLNPITKLIP